MVNITVSIEENDLKMIDKAAEKIKRTRSNYFLIAGLKYAKEINKEDDKI